MGAPRRPQPVKLFCGLLSGDVDLLRRARQLLVRCFGPTDLESEVWPFRDTEYYADEMGPDLLRSFLSFQPLVQPQSLAEIKLQTNAIEAEIADQCLRADVPRPVNLDPGYLDPGKIVLATVKDRSHRIYIGQGIYAEVTLHYADHAWRVWPWTYPDYRRPEYHAYFEEVRKKLLDQRREPPADHFSGDEEPQ
jgi:hypothetical protein